MRQESETVRPTRTRVSSVLLFMIIIVAIFLRAYRLNVRGLWQHDSGLYANIGKIPILAARWAVGDRLSNSTAPRIPLETYLRDHGALLALVGMKPGHTSLIALSFAILGIRDYAPLAISAFFGILTVYLVFHIGREWFNEEIGLIAAAVLAVSRSHVHFSRTAYPQTDTIFFSLLGTYFYYISRQNSRQSSWYLALSGLCFGLTLTMHQSVVIIILTVVLAEGLRTLHEGQIFGRRTLRRAFLLGLPMLVPVAIAELALRAVSILTGEDVLTFLERNVSQVENVAEAYHPTLSEVFFYPWAIWELEGPFVSIFLVVGFIFAVKMLAKKRSMAYYFVVAQFVFPLVYWSINTGGTPTLKGIQVAWPALALLAGFGFTTLLSWVVDRIRAPTFSVVWVVIVAVPIFLAISVYRNWELIHLRAYYLEAAQATLDYMEDNGGRMGAWQANLFPIWEFYLGTLVDTAPAEVRQLITFGTDEGDFMVSDYRRYTKPEFREQALKVAERCQPVITFPNPYVHQLPTYLLGLKGGTRLETMAESLSRYPDTAFIKVYDLRNCQAMSHRSPRDNQGQ